MEKALESKVADRLNVSYAEANRIVNAVRECLAESIVEDANFRWHGIGSFNTVQRAARTGRNPQTGEQMMIPAKMVVKFKPHKHLLDAVSK